uniref:Malic enzyme n=1 Tax=Haptolina brevifila TaxID=156173 RepID=A0A7S2DWM2_9EUKA|mmetsp:Transcript_44832/g.89545  ORF Transcript_44832/g.89545 Transcript_44832/m.89545 type:complete len:616 (+) Transcript_44832:94-1941(+)
MGWFGSKKAPAAAEPTSPATTVAVSRVEPWLAVQVEAAGGIDSWNKKDASRAHLLKTMDAMCQATTPEEALVEVTAIMDLGHNLWAYAYMRTLYDKQPEVYYSALLAKPSMLLPVVYTPTVGEACQKFGKMPHYRRGCYVSVEDRGHIKESLIGYAKKYMKPATAEGKYVVDCIVFSDGGRILGLGDLAAWGMGIPIGKLDLYTVCAGVDPYATIPVILDVGCYDTSGNTDKLTIRDHAAYTGLKKNRVTHTSPEGTVVNSAYYGANNMIEEFMTAATEIFVSNRGGKPLLQFEDFNSNDAFPLLETYHEKFLTYNDDIQGTAAVAVAGLMGAIKIRAAASGSSGDLMDELRKGVFLFHGAGSAGLGAAALLINEAGVPATQVYMTNSRGIIWKSADGSEGSFRNNEQKAFAQVGKPDYDSTNLVTCIEKLNPTCIIGAVGRAPGCFTKEVIAALTKANGSARPVVFALSNPKTQAEITADDAYAWSEGKVIYGSGTAFGPTLLNGVTHSPGQVNNFYIFPGMSFGAVACDAKTIPEKLFMVSATAVANSLSSDEIKTNRVMPHPDRIREVSLNVATAVVMEAQKMGLANITIGADENQVSAALKALMWSPGTVV